MAPQQSTQNWWHLLKETLVSWWNDDVQRLGASLAFYMVFSVAPLLVFALSIAGMIYGSDAAQGKLSRELNGAMGEQAAGAVQSLLAATQNAGQGPLATVLSTAALLVGASAAFNEFRTGLNRIWKVRPSESAPWWLTVKNRVMAFGLVLVVGLLFLALLVVSSAVSSAWSWLASDVAYSTTMAMWLNYFVTMAIETVLFALVFRYLPEGTIAWMDVWLGAFVTSVLVGIGNTLLSIYFGYSVIGSTYGAAGSLAILLLWIYYTAQVVYLGAEFTQVYARMYGSAIEPEAHAEEYGDVAASA